MTLLTSLFSLANIAGNPTLPLVTTLLILLLSCQHYSYGEDRKCSPKYVDEESMVCVCNASYCDTIESVAKIDGGRYWMIRSTKAGERFNKIQQSFSKNAFQDGINSSTVLKIDRNQTYQKILGFGGAFTDAAAINFINLTKEVRENLLRSYFSSDGLEYTFGRVPIGGCDFSTRGYTYDDDHDGDFNLTHFSLATEDLSFKIPMIQQALQMSSRPIKMYASPWSAPAWMKTNNRLIGRGILKGAIGGQYYQTWADYFVRFLDEYKLHNITFWGVTAQNEPMNGNIIFFPFNCLGFSAHSQSIFIGENLGPTLARRGYSDVKILMLDDQRLLLPGWAKEVLREDSPAKDYVDGIGVHWYVNFLAPSELLEITHNLFPDKFLLSTEACEGSQPFQKHTALGSWIRAETYASDIIDVLRHWTVGWVDWNLCLNTEGGPNWTGGAVDSPILINHDKNEFYKQPMYYSLGHFSKFILPDANVINLSSSQQNFNIDYVGIINPDNSTVVVILNRGNYQQNVTIEDPSVGVITTQLPAHSLQTYVWWV